MTYTPWIKTSPFIVTDSEGRVIANTALSSLNPEENEQLRKYAEDNAQKIAALPELLENLTKITETFEHICNCCDDGWLSDIELDAIEEAYAAIKKATS